MVQISHLYLTSGKIIALSIQTFVDKMMSLLFNMLSMFVIACLTRSTHLNFMAAIIVCSDLGAQENKLCQFPLSLYIFAMKWWDCISSSYFFECWVLSPLFCFLILPLSRGSVVLFHFLTLDLYHLHIWSCWYFSWQSWFQLAIHPAPHFAWYICIEFK